MNLKIARTEWDLYVSSNIIDTYIAKKYLT